MASAIVATIPQPHVADSTTIGITDPELENLETMLRIFGFLALVCAFGIIDIGQHPFWILCSGIGIWIFGVLTSSVFVARRQRMGELKFTTARRAKTNEALSRQNEASMALLWALAAFLFFRSLWRYGDPIASIMPYDPNIILGIFGGIAIGLPLAIILAVAGNIPLLFPIWKGWFLSLFTWAREHCPICGQHA